jgi:hypothetical protein
MKLHATAGTSMGELALFWPEQLPADFDQRFHDLDVDPDKLLTELSEAGQLLLVPASNGEYHLLILLNETISATLENYCTLAAKCEALQVAGEGWFTGVEFLFRADRSVADKHPRQCTPLQIPPGNYFAEVFSTDIPDDVYETWLRDQAGSSAQRWWWIQTWIASSGVVTFLVFVTCLFFATRQSVYLSLAVSSFLLSIAWLMSRTAGYKRVQQARRDYHEAYPDFVVRLR